MSLTIKTLLDKRRQKSDLTYPLVVRVVYNRKSINLQTGYALLDKDWDTKNQRIKKSSKITDNLTRFNNQLLQQRTDIFSILTKLEESKQIQGMTMKDIKNAILGKEESEQQTVFSYFERVIQNMKDTGKFGNSIVYSDSMKAWKKYRKEKDLLFQHVNYKMLRSFENFFLARKVKPNTISVYLRTFRALFNRAIKENIVSKEYYPFDQYKLPSNKTQKRAVTLDVISLIENYEPIEKSALWDSKNYFLFSFYTRGMNFIDMAYLTSENIKNGRIFYTRRKTGGEFSVKITPKAQAIIDLYTDHDKKGKDYLLPIITNPENEEKTFSQVKYKLQNFNKSLKAISKELDLEVTLSTYTARHSYATGLKNKGLSSEVIKESLGHAHVGITETYLKSFENSVVDEADDLLFEQ